MDSFDEKLLAARMDYFHEKLLEVKLLAEEAAAGTFLAVAIDQISLDWLIYILNAHTVETIQKDHDIEWEDVVNVTNAVLIKPIFEVTEERWYDAGRFFLLLSIVRTITEKSRPQLAPGTPKQIFKEKCPASLDADMNVYHPVSSGTYLRFGRAILQQFFQKESEVLPHTYQMAVIRGETLEKIEGDPEACKLEVNNLVEEAKCLRQRMGTELWTRLIELEVSEPNGCLDKLK